MRLVGLFCILLFSTLFVIPAFTQQPVTVSVLMNAVDAAQWQTIVKSFEQKNPDIRLRIVEGPNATNLVEDLYTSAFLLGDSPYDLVYMDVVWTPKFAAAGWLQDLSDKISAVELNNFLEVAVDSGRYQDKLYAVPHRTDAGMLYYRRDLLSEVGALPPETFEELLNTAKEMQQETPVNWGFAWQGRQYEGLAAMFVEILEGYGGYWVNPETKAVGLDQPQAIQAIEFLRQTIATGIAPPGVTTYGEEETRRLFQSGEVAFLRNWPYVWPLAQESSVAGKIGIKPMVHSPGNSSGACLGGWNLGISSTTRHPDAAWRAIQYLTSTEAQREFILGSGYLPTRPALFTDPQIVAKYDYYPELLEVVQQAVLRPPIPQYAQVSDILQRYLSAAITGRTDPVKAMQSAAEETRAILEQGQPQAQQPSSPQEVAA